MRFIELYGKEIFSIFITLLTWALNFFIKTKAKLQVGVPHQFTFLIQQPVHDDNGNILTSSQSVKTTSFIIRNAGRESATNVEIVFNWKPMCLNLWPARHYEENVEPDKRYVLHFDSLAPGEAIGIEILDINRDLPNLITARSMQSLAQNIEMFPQPAISNLHRNVLILLMLIGLASTIYYVLVLLQFLVLQTPPAR